MGYRVRGVKQGRFKPKNPEKYVGDANNIIYRSSWEKRLMIYLDSHPDVMNWSSEEVVILYLSPIDHRFHRYFPDFKVKMINKSGKEETLIIEVKPEKEQNLPVKRKRITESYLEEVATYAVNQTKWAAAKEYCADRGWRFVVMNEKDLGIGKRR
jgi:hypothetical protein